MVPSALSALRCPSRALVLHALRAFSSAPLPTTQATQYAPNAKEISLAQVERVAAADLALRRAHDAITVDASDAAEAHRKRLIFRSKQRGWLEVDLLMGAFATQHLASLTPAELVTYEQILGRETLDLYNLILGKEAPPPELAGPVLERIKAFVQTSPLGRASPADYAKTKGQYSN